MAQAVESPALQPEFKPQSHKKKKKKKAKIGVVSVLVIESKLTHDKLSSQESKRYPRNQKQRR
jgi:hypothetical protein